MSANDSQTVKHQVFKRIRGKGRGWTFTPYHFLDLGTRGSVGMALKSLCDAGQIRRLAPGLYDYPRHHRTLGDLLPTAEQIGQALADKDRSRIQPSGAYAANLLGLSDQVPAKTVFLTDATDRRITVGRREIILQRTTPKNMATAGRASGLVIQALRHLGQQHVDDQVLAKLRRTLSDADRRALMQDIALAPAWIGGIFRKLNAEST